MESQVIFLFLIRGFLGIWALFIAYMSLKYINQKALGMVTIFDHMIQDLIYLSMLHWTAQILLDLFLEFMVPLNHSVAKLITFFCHILRLLFVWQLSVIFVIRYLSVFYQNVLNSSDDCSINRITRCFIGSISVITLILYDSENSNTYSLLTKKEMKSGELLPGLGPFFVASFICLILLIFTQYKVQTFVVIKNSVQFFKNPNLMP